MLCWVTKGSVMDAARSKRSACNAVQPSRPALAYLPRRTNPSGSYTTRIAATECSCGGKGMGCLVPQVGLKISRFWSTSRRKRSRAASGLPIWGHWQWNQGSGWQQLNCGTAHSGSDYSWAAHLRGPGQRDGGSVIDDREDDLTLRRSSRTTKQSRQRQNVPDRVSPCSPIRALPYRAVLRMDGEPNFSAVLVV